MYVCASSVCLSVRPSVRMSVSKSIRLSTLCFTGQYLVFINTRQIEGIAVTGRAHCQRQVAFLKFNLYPEKYPLKVCY